MSRRIHYVGITRQPVARRFYLGFRATGKRGYYGYAWKHLRGPLRLFVWSFPKRKPALMKKFEKELETIEGEVVFLIRKVTNKWPMSQTEIHFHQPRAAHRAAAAAIFAEVTK